MKTLEPSLCWFERVSQLGDNWGKERSEPDSLAGSREPILSVLTSPGLP